MPDFITVQEVKDRTQVSGVTDEALIQPFITTAQDKYIRQALGADFYIALKAMNPPAGVFATLVDDYIVPALAWYTLLDAFPRIKSRVHNGGVFNRSSQDTAPIDTNSNDREMGWIRETADTYLRIMVKYLNDNSTDYPLWQTSENCETRGGSNNGLPILIF